MAPHETASVWAELAARLKRGDERALECVLREMGPPIAGVLCHKFERVLSWADENVEPQYLAQLIDDSFSMLCKQYCLRAEMT